MKTQGAAAVQVGKKNKSHKERSRKQGKNEQQPSSAHAGSFCAKLNPERPGSGSHG